MATILEFDPQTANSLATALGSHSVVMTDAADVVTQVAKSGDSLVVIGPSIDDDVAARVTASTMASFPSGGVVWCRRRVDTSTVLAAVRAGAADVVAEADLPALVHAATRVVERTNRATANQHGEAAKQVGAKVTAVYAAKGGCGKTSIATNLAAMLASEMKQRVCLLDLDLESGDVQLLAALPPGRSILDLVELEQTLDAISLAACMQQHRSGMYVLPAPRRPEEAAGITPTLVTNVLNVVRTMFDHVIIDCPPYATEHVLSVFDATDVLGLICTPDAASVKNTAIALELFEELNIRASISLILNHAGDNVGITTADIADALERRIEHEIPSSLDMPSATNRAELLSMTNNAHPTINAIRGWAHRINPPAPTTPAPRQAAVPQQRQTAAKVRRAGLFRRRVAST